MEKMLVTHRVSDELDLRSTVTLIIAMRVAMQPRQAAGLTGFLSTLKVSIGR